jgi:hypothetical protein
VSSSKYKKDLSKFEALQDSISFKVGANLRVRSKIVICLANEGFNTFEPIQSGSFNMNFRANSSDFI